jgi:hypothetical protein
MLARIGYLLAVLALAAVAASAGVKGYGAFPVTPKTLSVWINGENGDPVVMVYYHGPANWSDRHWDFNFQYDKDIGLHEYKSPDLTLRVRVDLGTGRAEVQDKLFSLAQNNTFLVVHTTDAQRRVIPLGHHNLLKTAQNPASVMLLDSDKSLKKRIENEAGSI